VRLEKLLQEGLDNSRQYQATWGEMREVIQERTKTAAVEQKRINDLHGMVPVDQVLGFAKALMTVMREVIRSWQGKVVDEQELLHQVQEKTLYLLPAPTEE
jgi:hypothetical protein